MKLKYQQIKNIVREAIDKLDRSGANANNHLFIATQIIKDIQTIQMHLKKAITIANKYRNLDHLGGGHEWLSISYDLIRSSSDLEDYAERLYNESE